MMKLKRPWWLSLFIVLISSGCATRTDRPLAWPERLAAMKASYQCNETPQAGMPEVGNPSDPGCYFVLYSPTTGHLLPNTRYVLELRPVSNDGTENDEGASMLETGVTDALGRSKYLHIPFKMDPQGTRFVEIIGEGRYKAGFSSYTRGHRSPEMVANDAYSLTDSTGAVVYRGFLDYRGHTVVYESKTDDPVRYQPIRSSSLEQ